MMRSYADNDLEQIPFQNLKILNTLDLNLDIFLNQNNGLKKNEVND
jgi:hypothetical protein